MRHARTRTALLLGCLTTTGLLTGPAGGGQETETAYANFPEVPSTWYATGCCAGAIIADDIQVAEGTEGMQLAEIIARLYVNGAPTGMTLLVFRHDEDTGLPGELLGAQDIGPFPPDGYQVVPINVWNMNIRIPASGRLWIGVYAPGGGSGWNMSDAEASVGSTGNFYARNSGEGFEFRYPFEEVEFVNMMLRVEVAPDPCPADLNGDNVVDVDDLVEVVLDWGCADPPEPCTGDVNADGIVDVDDLVEIVLAWGNCFDM
ncbi:MAG: hypothetical protein ACYTJ0_14765 [Planctomycetota bacterium]|jgi:hypothetical protein